jgi:hypothetical protein
MTRIDVHESPLGDIDDPVNVVMKFPGGIDRCGKCWHGLPAEAPVERLQHPAASLHGGLSPAQRHCAAVDGSDERCSLTVVRRPLPGPLSGHPRDQRENQILCGVVLEATIGRMGRNYRLARTGVTFSTVWIN